MSVQSRERQQVAGRSAGAVAYSRPPVEYPSRLRSRSSVKRGLEDNTALYSQEKKLWVNVAASNRLPPFVCLSHAYASYDPFRK